MRTRRNISLLWFLLSSAVTITACDRPADTSSSNTEGQALAQDASATQGRQTSPARRAAEFFEDGQRRLRARDYAAASIQFRNALQVDPDNLPALIGLGRSLHGEGLLSPAMEAFRRAQIAGADWGEIALDKARTQFELASYNDMLSEARLDGVPSDAQVPYLLLLARAAVRVRGTEAASEWIDQAVTLAPADPRPRVVEIELALEAGNNWRTETLMDRLMRDFPDAAEAHYLAAQIALRDGDKASAAAAFARASAAAPLNADVARAHAQFMLLEGRIDDAVALVEPVYDADNPDPEIAYTYAMALLASQAEEEATTVLEPVVALLNNFDERAKARYPGLVKLSAVVNLTRGDLDRARDDAEAFVLLEPDSPEGRFLLGDIELRQGDASAAVTHLAVAAREARHNPHIQARYGEALLGTGKLLKALDVLESIHRVAPDNAEVRVAYARALLANEEFNHAAPLITPLAEAGNAQAVIVLTAALIGLDRQDEAVDRARAFAFEFPTHPRAGTLLAIAERSAGNIDAAREALTGVLESRPGDTTAGLELGAIELASGNAEAAEKVFASILERESANPAALKGLAAVAELRGRFEEAADLLERARAVSALDQGTQQQLIRLYLLTGRQLEALEIADSLANRFPEEVSVLLLQARVLEQVAQPKRARSILRRAVRFAGYDVAELHQIASLQMRLDDFEGAEKTLARAEQADGGNLAVQVSRIRLDIAQGATTQARERVLALRTRFPDSALADILTAEIEQGDHNSAAAAEALHAAFTRQPEEALLLKLAPLLMNLGERDRAIESLEAWRQAHPDAFQTQQMLAGIYLETDAFEKAKPLITALASKFPNHPGVLNNQAWLALRNNEIASGIELARRAREAAPNSASIADTLALLLIANGESSEAIGLLREAISRDSNAPGIQYHLALALMGEDPSNPEIPELLEIAVANPGFFSERDAAEAMLDNLRR